MNKLDFNAVMMETAQQNKGKRLLLHCCCAPCASACLFRLKDFFKITVLFYNPNISGEEYLRRKEELLRLITLTGWADFLEVEHEEEKFLPAIQGHEGDKEGGDRCKICFDMRLEKTATLAENYGFDFFTTTLTLSPMKNATLLNEIGKSKENTAKWLYSDFKKANGYLKSIELSRDYDLYRQDYCGCEFSKRDTNDK